MTQENNPHNYLRLPIGSPILPFLLMALLACGVIYYRRRKLTRA